MKTEKTNKLFMEISEQLAELTQEGEEGTMKEEQLPTRTALDSVARTRILDTEIPIIEYKGERVITFKMIDTLHQRPEGTAGRNFRQNRNRFKIDKHYFEVGRDEFRRDLWEAYGFSKFAAKGILMTKRGYTMLVKSLDDDLAWDVQEELAEHYFLTYEYLTPAQLLLRVAHITAEMERKQLVLEDKVSDLEYRVTTLETKAVPDSDVTGFMTIRAYCDMHGSDISRKEAACRGRRAAMLSKKMGIAIGKPPGKVRSYHKDVLEEIFKDLLPKRKP